MRIDECMWPVDQCCLGSWRRTGRRTGRHWWTDRSRTWRPWRARPVATWCRLHSAWMDRTSSARSPGTRTLQPQFIITLVIIIIIIIIIHCLKEIAWLTQLIRTPGFGTVFVQCHSYNKSLVELWNKMLSYRREIALQGALVFAKSKRLELGDNNLRTV